MILRLVRNLYNVYNTIRNNKRINYLNQEVIITEEKNSPFSFFNYIFINKEQLENTAYLEPILKHETCHSKQIHSLDILLVELLICFSWFNPFIWLFKKEIETNHEFLADAYVVSKGTPVEYYSTLIVQQSKKAFSNIYSGFSFIKSKNRLHMLHSKKTSIIKNSIKVSFSVLLFLGVLLLSSSTIFQEKKPFIVLVDAGHGGKDAGQLDEKTINLQIVNQLAELAAGTNIKIITTRNTDQWVTLEERAQMIKSLQPDLFLSLHCNFSSNKGKHGVEGYYSTDTAISATSKSFTEILVQKQLKDSSNNGSLSSSNKCNINI